MKAIVTYGTKSFGAALPGWNSDPIYFSPAANSVDCIHGYAPELGIVMK
jgi:hypothetical protein